LAPASSTLSLHDALPISVAVEVREHPQPVAAGHRQADHAEAPVAVGEPDGIEVARGAVGRLAGGRVVAPQVGAGGAEALRHHLRSEEHTLNSSHDQISYA